MGKDVAELGKPSQTQLHTDLITYQVNPKLQFCDTCDRCGHEFIFTGKDVKNRTMQCPKCGNTMAFFRSNYE